VGLEVYYPTDLRNALLAAEHAVKVTANASNTKDDPFTTGFLAGYQAALTTLALAFGLSACTSSPMAEWKAGLLTTASPASLPCSTIKRKNLTPA